MLKGATEEIKKTFKIFFDQEKILNLIFLKDLRGTKFFDDQVELIKKDIIEALKEQNKKIPGFFIDISIVSCTQFDISSQSRRIVTELLKEMGTEKIAFCGGGLVIKTVVKFISIRTNKEDQIKWFARKKEAREWLLKKQYI